MFGRTKTITADYAIGSGGYYGRHFDLFDPESFGQLDLNTAAVHAWGHWSPLPRAGQTALLECTHSWVKFRIERVEPMRDPPDMFFAELRAVDQVMKPDA